MIRDVELVIRARDEASRAANAIAETLDHLARAANSAGQGSGAASSKIEVLGSMLAKAQREYKSISGAVDGATAAYARQSAALAETQAQQTAVTRQAEAARATLARLKAETVADGAAKVAHSAKIKLVEQALKALERQEIQLTTASQRQSTALNESTLALQRLGSNATASEIALVEAAIQRSAAATRELSSATATQAEKYREMASEARAASTASDAQQTFNNALRVGTMPGKSAAMSAETFREAAIAEDDMAIAAARLRAQIDPLAASQAHLNGRLAEARALYESGKISASELASAERVLAAEAKRASSALSAGRGERGRGGLFGFKPYELQNLAYQLNDVGTQLASGTSLSQTMAQQGGQILQLFLGRGGGGLFVRIGAGAAAMAPQILVGVAALAVLVGVMKQAANLAASEKLFGSQLAASADGGLYDPAALAESAKAIDVWAGSLKEARAQLTELTRDGVAPVYLERMAITARDMAQIFGIDLKDATKQVGEAFTGNYESIKKLDDATNFLTLAQREHIKRLFEEKKSAEALTYAFAIYEEKMNGGAAKMRGTWSNSMHVLSQAWSGFLTWLSKTGPIKFVLDLLADIADMADKAIKKLLRVQTLGPVTRAEKELADLTAERAVITARTGGGMPRDPMERRAVMSGRTPGGRIVRMDGAAVDAEIAAKKAELGRLRKAEADTRAPGSEQGAKRDRDKAEADAKKAEAAARRASRSAESAAEALERKRESIENSLQSSLAQLESQAGKAQTESLDARLEAVDKAYNKIKQALEDARANGVTTVEGESLADYEARVEAAKTLLKQQVELKFRSEQIAALEEQRTTRLKNITDQVAEGSMSAVEAARAAQTIDDELAPQMEAAARAALAFAYALRTARPNPELEAYIARMERALRREGAPGGANSEPAKLNLSSANTKSQEINELISQRTELIQAADELFERGAIMWEEREQRIRDAYAATTPEIEKQTRQLEDLIRVMFKQGEISPAIYAVWRARIEATRVDLVDLYTQVLSVGDANDMLVNSGVGAWDKFVAAVQGGQNAFAALFDAVRSSVAELLTDLSKLIVKALLMRAIMKSPLGKWLSGAINGAFDSAGAMKAAQALNLAGAVLNLAAVNLKAAAAALAQGGGSSGGGSTTSTIMQIAANLFGDGGSSAGGTYHTGGVVTGGRPGRTLPSVAWANARRFHGGGMPGLRPNEVTAILEKGEEVLASDNPRHVGNGGGRRGDVKVVNVFNPADVLEQALGTTDGERVLVNYVRQNRAAFKAALA